MNRSPTGVTPLIKAVQYNELAMVKALLKFTANVNNPDYLVSVTEDVKDVK
jgi:ankyrin repeat protein